MARSYSRGCLIALVLSVLLPGANGAWQKGTSLVMSQGSAWHTSIVELNNAQAAVCIVQASVVCNIVSLNGTTLTKGANLVLPTGGSSLEMAATVNTGRLLVASNIKGQLPDVR